MTNKFDKSDEKLREQYEEAFFQQLMEGYEEYQGERLKRESEADNIEGPSAELIAQMEAKIAKKSADKSGGKQFPNYDVSENMWQFFCCHCGRVLCELCYS